MDKVLKQRLVGASILIALAVIFLPMLFDKGGSDADEQRELALDLPDRQSGDRRVRRLALDPDQARTPPSESQAEAPRETRPEPTVRQREAQPAEDESRPKPVQPEPEEAASAQEPEEQTEPTSSQPAAPESAPAQEEAAQSGSGPARLDDANDGAERESAPAPAASVEGSWVVQVAVFSNRETANSVRQRLGDLGHRVSMDVLIRDQAELFRLRTGPYADESTAEQARSQIAATVAGVDPVSRELSGGGDAEERSGLAVQVGSFASHNNAERLVGQLAEVGFDAFMYGEETGGRTIWRVRVGTYEERAEAESLLETLREERGLEGIVVSHP